jgi:ubiquinone biosynthesis protein
MFRLLPDIGSWRSEPRQPERQASALLEDLGGTFIKLGQVLSLQPDLIPSSYCDEFFDLLDRVPPFDYPEVERIFVEDLGRRPADIFDSFDRMPFASASIGQVHRASLGGQELAVKVRRPTALRDFGGDIRLMKGLIQLITKLRLKRFDGLRVPLNEFVAWTDDELDYRREARYMEQVRVNTGERPEAKVPTMYPELSTARILTAEFLNGTTLLEYLRSLDREDPAIGSRLEEIGFDPEVFAENVLANFLSDVFQHGMFHADLHPANLLILPNNVVGYVDFGITGVISEYGSHQVLAMILALARQDVDEILEGIFRISEVTDDSDIEGFRRGLRELSETWFAGDRTGSGITTGYTLIMLDLIRLSRQCALLPHEEAMRYMRSVVTADGLIARFAPDFDVNRSLERLSKKHLRSRAMAATFSADKMIESWIAGTRLMRDGAHRLDRLLDKLEKGESVARKSRRGKRQGEKTQSSPRADRVLRLGASVLAIAVMMIAGQEPVEPGLNLFVAQAVLIGVGSLLLSWTVLRWMFSRS